MYFMEGKKNTFKPYEKAERERVEVAMLLRMPDAVTTLFDLISSNLCFISAAFDSLHHLLLFC